MEEGLLCSTEKVVSAEGVQDNPILTRIDRIFVTPSWENLYKDPVIHPQSSSISDRCPLLLMPMVTEHKSRRFRFESFWVDLPGYQSCVLQNWQQATVPAHNPLLTLHIKLNRTARGLRRWAKTIVPQVKIPMAVCREVIARLDTAQEERQLTSEGSDFRKFLKNRLLGLSAIEKARARQQSRITWLRKGDANTKYFQIMANVRKKNYIYMLQSEGGVVTSRRKTPTNL